MHATTVYRQPWRLHADNFTPPTRTPWGGRRIVTEIKAQLELSIEKRAYSVVGESWEVSVEPNFPSRVIGMAGEPLLQDLISADPSSALGPDIAQRLGGLPLLVKLLDTAQNLSVQVHPTLDSDLLGPNQSGKPEAWLILTASPGAGLYLGFRDGVTARDVELALRSGGDLTPLLNFVSVETGDCFQIAAGTVHAIGGGVTLLEPQHVTPGKEAVTYRFWDWNRRYDQMGRLSPAGTPRQLHQEQSLAAASFDLTGDAFVASLRRSAKTVQAQAGGTHETLLADGLFHLDHLKGNGAFTVAAPTMVAGVVLSGRVACSAEGGNAAFARGEAFVLPAAAGSAEYLLEDAEVVLCWSTP